MFLEFMNLLGSSNQNIFYEQISFIVFRSKNNNQHIQKKRIFFQNCGGESYLFCFFENWNNFQMGDTKTKRIRIIAYRLFFSIGILAFTSATITTIPYFNQQTSLKLYQFFMKASSIIMSISELLELISQPVPNWRNILCLFGIIGQATYFYSAITYKPFNNGLGYIFAALIISINAELKLLSIVLEKRDYAEIIRKGKRRFYQFGFNAFGTVLFLLGTVSRWGFQASSSNVAIWNVLGGLICSLSIISLIKRKPKEYRTIETAAMDIEMISAPS